jgi:hypothetical protein
MSDTSPDTEVEQQDGQRGKGPCAACDASVCEFD